MEQAKGRDLQRSITREALALLELGCGEENVAKYEQAIQLIGVACDTTEETEKLLGLIAQAKDNPGKLQSGEIRLDQRDAVANWSAHDTFWVLMDLFQVSIGMDTQEHRTAMYSLADEIIGTQNFEEQLVGTK